MVDYFTCILNLDSLFDNWVNLIAIYLRYSSKLLSSSHQMIRFSSFASQCSSKRNIMVHKCYPYEYWSNKPQPKCFSRHAPSKRLYNIKTTSNKTKYHLACNLLILQKYNTIVASTFYYNTTRLKINCEKILQKEQRRRDQKEQIRHKRKEWRHEQGEHRWKNLTRTKIECQEKNMNFDNNNEK